MSAGVFVLLGSAIIALVVGLAIVGSVPENPYADTLSGRILIGLGLVALGALAAVGVVVYAVVLR